MLKFRAISFVQFSARLSSIEGTVETARYNVSKETRDLLLTKYIYPLCRMAEISDLDVSLAYLRRLEQRMKGPSSISARSLGGMLEQLRERIEDELSAQLLYQIPKEKGKFYTPKEPLFGSKVFKSFPSSRGDIEKAGRCYAVGLNTACIFHLMRVMELALRALGESLHDESLNPKTNPTWERILKRCDDELKLPIKQRSVEWQSDGDFYVNATANLRAVKDAWRNPTMHIDRDYDDEEALDVINAVKGFMRHIATRLKEK
jgi:hypothetical protein